MLPEHPVDDGRCQQQQQWAFSKEQKVNRPGCMCTGTTWVLLPRRISRHDLTHLQAFSPLCVVCRIHIQAVYVGCVVQQHEREVSNCWSVAAQPALNMFNEAVSYPSFPPTFSVLRVFQGVLKLEMI